MRYIDLLRQHRVTYYWPMVNGDMREVITRQLGARTSSLGIGPLGERSKIADFNGSSDNANSVFSLSLSRQLSISCWFRWDAFADDDDLLMELSTNANGNDAFFIDPNRNSVSHDWGVMVTHGAQQRFYTHARPSQGAWHHYGVQLDRDQTQVVMLATVDGASQSLTAITTGSVSGSDWGSYVLYFMSRAGSSLFADGGLCHVAFFSGRLLTVNEFRNQWLLGRRGLSLPVLGA